MPKSTKIIIVKKYKESILDIFEILFIALAIFLLVYIFVGQLLEVTGDSMHPTLKNKEQIIAEKITTKFNPLKRGEIVIFEHPKENNRLLIKRVIGLPNEELTVYNGNVYINSNKLHEPYLPEGTITSGSVVIKENTPYKIPDYEYVLMGDNRTESSDSRAIGPIKLGDIVGRAMLVYFPISSIRGISN